MANLAEQLQAVKLRKSKEPIKDFSSAKTAGFMKEEDIKEYETVVLDANTERWIDILREETFPTVLCPFAIEEADVFLSIYKRLYLGKDSTVISSTDWRQNISDHENDVLNQLAKRLQTSMDIYTKNGYAFVKTSSRSAKDAPLVQDKFKQLYVAELESFTKPELTENVQITCLLKAAFLALKVKTSDEVLDMFLRSERIYQDLLLAAVNQREKYDENFVIRKFYDIDIDMEFRGFVYNYELVALSQYNYLICSSRLVERKTEYGEMVKGFYDSVVKPKLKTSNFSRNSIVDFAICDDGNKFWVIEINPYLETTDGALFSWQSEKDLLQGGRGFQFRITEKVRPGAKTMLPQSVRALLEQQTAS